MMPLAWMLALAWRLVIPMLIMTLPPPPPLLLLLWRVGSIMSMGVRTSSGVMTSMGLSVRGLRVVMGMGVDLGLVVRMRALGTEIYMDKRRRARGLRWVVGLEVVVPGVGRRRCWGLRLGDQFSMEGVAKKWWSLNWLGLVVVSSSFLPR
ncbi:hypothetical protein IWZ03DRAFT_384149 [Phyllosticta citriasiana]|uniref:Secreted protein n=1 Tax=Phyllosticta citriasiana TaxID=595635 RepID=A0ABR1KDJ2_9PEZI